VWNVQVQQAAKLKGVDPLLYCNELAADFKVTNVFRSLNSANERFGHVSNILKLFPRCTVHITT